MNNSLMDVFLDLDQPNHTSISDEILANSLLAKFQSIIVSIGKRIKQIKRIGFAYDTPSVALYDQAKDLYCLGYFFSSVIVCRSTAEYLAYEIFFEEVELEGKSEIIESVAENLDFRKIVNEFLYNPKKNYLIIDKKAHDLFNELYTLGNQWTHPKKLIKGVRIENEAFKSIEILGSLLSSLRDVTKDYDLSNGMFMKKPTARKKIRPIILGSGGRIER